MSIYQDTSVGNATKNPFLAHAILYTLSYVCTQGVLLSVDDGDDDLTVSDKLQTIFGGGRSLHLIVRGANDFYSQQNYLIEVLNAPICAAALRQVPPFANLIGAVSKTGLGSSAALTSSVVAALFHFARLQIFPHGAKMLEEHDEVEVIHRLAQSAHCVAQGKVGSGFDVYTACYGTCAYTRFAASKIEPLMPKDHDHDDDPSKHQHRPHQHEKQQHKEEEEEEEFSSKVNVVSVDLDTLSKVIGNFKKHVKAQSSETPQVAQDEWVPRAVIPGGGSFQSGLPRNFKLLLADVHAGGTETPGMVHKIFAWKKTLDAQDETNLWNRLAQANIHCIEALLGLIRLQDQSQPAGEKSHVAAEDFAGLRPKKSEDYRTAARIVAQLSGNDDEGWAKALEHAAVTSPAVSLVLHQFDRVRTAFAQCRSLLREVGEKAEVEIEPPALTPLLDETLKHCKGVVAVGCPGAGGYDAVFALAVDPPVIGNEPDEDEDNKSKSGHVCAHVEQFWESYVADELQVCPLLVRESGGGLKF